MFEILPKSSGSLLAIKASGKLTVQDYEHTLLPKLEELFEQYKQLKLFVTFSEDFSGWASTAAAWDDMKIGLDHAGDFEKIAMVGGPEWVGWSAKLFSIFVHGEVKVFPIKNDTKAMAWLNDGGES